MALRLLSHRASVLPRPCFFIAPPACLRGMRTGLFHPLFEEFLTS